MQKIPDNKIMYDMHISWVLSRKCNFSCVYCPVAPKNKRAHEIDIDTVIERLNKFDKTILIHLSGGEPFLIPNFAEFVNELTKKHYVRIDTNLSLLKACKKFIDLISPEKVVEIIFSVHAIEREKRNLRLHDLCDLVKKFKNNGFKMIGNYVLYPPLIGQIREDIDFLNSYGIKVFPTLFHGTYNKTNYPIHRGILSHSNEELQLIKKMNPQALRKIYKTKNKICPAGSSAFAINSNYEVFPCVMIKKKLGEFFDEWNVFPRVLRCPVEYCFCRFYEEFPGSPAPVKKSPLLAKTIQEKGVFSVSKSRRITFTFYQFVIDILRQTTIGQPLRKIKHLWLSA